MDLASFVSDYVAMCRAEGEQPSAREIAIAFADQEPELSVAFEARVDELVPQIAYYLPAR